jgi:CheY-like chemotaxis protein
MDVQMPEMDGFEAAAAIRAREQVGEAHLPIIAMTAHAIKGDRERCLDAGMDGYVSKPIDARALFDEIDRVLSSMPAAATVPPVNSRVPISSPAVDWSAARAALGDDRRLLAEVARMFQNESAALMDTLRQALDAWDAPRVARTAHTLKGSIGVLAARQAQEAAWVLESVAKSGDLAGAPAALDKLATELERVYAALAHVA